MTTDEVRKKYIEFFKKAPRSHKEISPAPLVPQDDPTTLFTSSGMQQLIPNLMGESHPEGKRLVNSQPCFRAVDMESVGNLKHTTFFEMLGNWSLDDYFKEEQLNWFWEFLTKELKLPKEKLWISVFKGTKEVPKDKESFEIWKKIGVSKDKIFYYEDNWWSRSGSPEDMPEGEIGGPDSEVFFDFGENLNLHENSEFKDKVCHPNCDCGRFLEIGNSVFIQHIKEKDGSLEELPQKNVDFGGGLERITAAVNNEPDIFKTDSFEEVINTVEEFTKINYGNSEKDNRNFRIFADHLRAACFLIAEGTQPSNKLQGYVLRRLIRRSVFSLRNLGFEIEGGAISTFARPYGEKFEIIQKNWSIIKDTLNKEAVKFSRSLKRGLRKLKSAFEKKIKIDGKFAFDLYQTDGFPIELTLEMLMQEGVKFSKKQREIFEKEFEKHKELSRTASAGMFKGGLADHSEEVTKLHTVTHLLHASLRKVLGEHVEQKGSNITAERLRFDFSHNEKLSDKEIKRLENLINEQIEKGLPMTYKTKSFRQAQDEGALAFFGGKYGEKVKVYIIGSPENPFSREICGGPHVTNTSEIGRVRIKKQEKIGAGLVRIYAVLK